MLLIALLESADEARSYALSSRNGHEDLLLVASLGNQSTNHHRNMNGEATGPAKTAGAAVPVIIEKRWKSELQNPTETQQLAYPGFQTAYTPSRVDASCDLISLYGLKPLYQAFVRPSTSSKPGLASDVKPSTEEGSSGLGRRVQLPPGIGALLAEQSSGLTCMGDRQYLYF
jgi:hypothetical protein